jgi:hypothetical protein
MVQVGMVVHIMPLLVADPEVVVLTAIMLVVKAPPDKVMPAGLEPMPCHMLPAVVVVQGQWVE